VDVRLITGVRDAIVAAIEDACRSFVPMVVPHNLIVKIEAAVIDDIKIIAKAAIYGQPRK